MESNFSFALKFFLPERCSECKFENLKMFGQRINGNVKLIIKCGSCGEPLKEVVG